KAVIVDTPVRIWSDDFDLNAEGFNYDHGTETITVKGSVTGKLKDGDWLADQVQNHVGDKSLKGHNASWTGPMALIEGQQKSNWHYTGKDIDFVDGIAVVTDAKGEDGDMIIKCNKMTYDRDKDIVTADGAVRYWGK